MASRSCSAPSAIRTWYLADLPDIRLRGAFGAQTGNDIGHGLDLACGHVVVAEREDFQQRQRFLRLFERGDILQDSRGLAVLGDDHRQPIHDLSQVDRRVVTGKLARPEGFEPPTNGFGR